MLIHNAVLTGSLVLPSVLPITGSLIMTGSIGIGTVSPTARLHVSGTTGILLEADGVNAVNALVVSSSGFVGIGTSNPVASLHVAGAIAEGPSGEGVLMGIQSNYAVIHLNGASGTGALIDFSTSGTDYKGRIEYDNNTNYMRFGTNGAERMRITSSGSVGIGTTGPRATLQVSNPTAGTPVLPSAGQSGSYTSLYLTNLNFQYGMLMGSLPNGNSWIQVQRTDGTATTYDLQLQPNGGSVTAGATISAGTYLQSASGIYLTSGAGNNAAIGSTRGGFSTTFALNLASILPGANFASNNYAIWLTIMATNVAIQYNVLVNGSVNTINSAGSNPVTGTSWSGTAAAPVLTFTASTNQYWSAILWCCGT
jgi:hypothetical protein